MTIKKAKTIQLPTNFPLIVYREVNAVEVNDINLDAVGIFWTDEAGYAESYNEDLVVHEDSNRKAFLLSTKVTKEQIDWPKTKKARADKNYGSEREITLKRGLSLQITIEGGGKQIKKTGKT